MTPEPTYFIPASYISAAFEICKYRNGPISYPNADTVFIFASARKRACVMACSNSTIALVESPIRGVANEAHIAIKGRKEWEKHVSQALGHYYEVLDEPVARENLIAAIGPKGVSLLPVLPKQDRLGAKLAARLVDEEASLVSTFNSVKNFDFLSGGELLPPHVPAFKDMLSFCVGQVAQNYSIDTNRATDLSPENAKNIAMFFNNIGAQKYLSSAVDVRIPGMLFLSATPKAVVYNTGAIAPLNRKRMASGLYSVFGMKNWVMD